MRNPSRRYGRALHRARRRHQMRIDFDNWVFNPSLNSFKVLAQNLRDFAKALQPLGQVLRRM